MVHTYEKYCQYEECNKSASFNFRDTREPIFCSEHKKPKMINVRNKKCVKCGEKVAEYNNVGNTPMYCYVCKTENMGKTKNRKCVECGTKRAFYNYREKRNPKYCRSCAIITGNFEKMINTRYWLKNDLFDDSSNVDNSSISKQNDSLKSMEPSKISINALTDNQSNNRILSGKPLRNEIHRKKYSIYEESKLLNIRKANEELLNIGKINEDRELLNPKKLDENKELLKIRLLSSKNTQKDDDVIECKNQFDGNINKSNNMEKMYAYSRIDESSKFETNGNSKPESSQNKNTVCENYKIPCPYCRNVLMIRSRHPKYLPSIEYICDKYDWNKKAVGTMYKNMPYLCTICKHNMLISFTECGNNPVYLIYYDK
jgi:hypothetical protein